MGSLARQGAEESIHAPLNGADASKVVRQELFQVITRRGFGEPSDSIAGHAPDLHQGLAPTETIPDVRPRAGHRLGLIPYINVVSHAVLVAVGVVLRDGARKNTEDPAHKPSVPNAVPQEGAPKRAG